MFRRLFCILLCLVLLPGVIPAQAETGYLKVAAPAETVRPGKAITIVFDAPVAGDAAIRLINTQKQVVSVIAEGYKASAGRNELWWNGTWQGVPAPEGSYTLTVELNGETATAPCSGGFLAKGGCARTAS